MDKVLVLDFGGQYNQLIARRVREQHVFAEIRAYDRMTPESIRESGYKAVIFTGGPNSVYDPSSPHFEPAVLNLGIPILGICYGMQLMAYMAGGAIESAESGSEYGRTELTVSWSGLFEGVPAESVCWMSHTDYVKTPPKGFRVIAKTPSCPCAAMADEGRKLYGVQFHPEVTHTAFGAQMFRNFLFGICGLTPDWTMEGFAERSTQKYRAELAGKKVLLGLSGGVDSSVAAALLHRAIGNDLRCVYVDALQRKDEGDTVERVFRHEFGMNLTRVRAEGAFLEKLRGVTEPEKKRKIIGEEFIRTFESAAMELGRADYLAQGTIYPDVIESGLGASAVIKSHHNVGGLPDRMAFDGVVEPLRELFKDEVRAVGEQLGLPRELVWRQPFPGPGLAVRIIGEVTGERLSTLREADAIFREEAEAAGNPGSQYFAVLTDLHSVGVMGDARTYGCTVVLRSVTTDDFMTAEWTHLPYEVLERASSRITNEVKGVSRVVYDITGKPPATVEWE